MKKHVGEIIKEIRQSKGITQADIAEKLGLRQSNYSKYENGAVKLTKETLAKIAKILGVDISVFNEAIFYKETPKANEQISIVSELKSEIEKLNSVIENHKIQIQFLNVKNELLENKILQFEKFIKDEIDLIISEFLYQRIGNTYHTFKEIPKIVGSEIIILSDLDEEMGKKDYLKKSNGKIDKEKLFSFLKYEFDRCDGMRVLIDRISEIGFGVDTYYRLLTELVFNHRLEIFGFHYGIYFVYDNGFSYFLPE